MKEEWEREQTKPLTTTTAHRLIMLGNVTVEAQHLPHPCRTVPAESGGEGEGRGRSLSLLTFLTWIRLPHPV